MQFLCLPTGLTPQKIPGLFAWLRRGTIKVSKLRAQWCSPLLDTVLGALPALRTPTICIDMHNMISPSIQLLSSFDCLQKCLLRPVEDKTFNLSPLQHHLPHLTSLHLVNGGYVEFEGLQHLTCLILSAADISSQRNCGCVHSLKHFACSYGSVTGLHQHALAACVILEVLQLEHVVMEDTQRHIQLDYDFSSVPPSMSCLTNLTRLELGDGDLSLLNTVWVSDLTTLKDLTITYGRFDCEALNEMMNLTQLTKLSFNYSGCVINAKKTTIDCLWHCLAALEELSFSDVITYIEERSAESLLQLTRLRKLRLMNVSATCSDGLSVIAALLHQISVSMPQVQATPNGAEIQSVLQQKKVESWL